MKTLLIRLGLIVVVLGLLVAAWQTAYARGRDAGRMEVAALRSEFVQARQAGGAVSKTGAGPGGLAGGQRPGVNGTIEQVDGQRLTIATSDGTVTVSLSDGTRISRQTPVSPSEIKAGDRVLVVGEKRGDTEYSATAIQIQDRAPAGQ